MFWLLPLLLLADPAAVESPRITSDLIFPLNAQHNHAPGIVECPNGDLFVSWYRGSGERRADDVAVYGAWLPKGETQWTEPFVLADTPGFPDCNTALFLDDQQRIWLFYPTILANSWESCLTNFKVSSQFAQPGLPKWDREGLILLKPDDFGEQGRQRLDEELKQIKQPLTDKQQQEIEQARVKLGDKLFQRLGWQPRCKPTQLPSGRLLLPLYSDTFSISIMAISDDRGQTWRASQPLLGFGNIQPTVLRRNDGTLVAYMRENGYSKRVRVCESKDNGETWGHVGASDLPNPGSGLDGLRLASGAWALVYNDTTSGRRSLVVSLSFDEGRTWPKTRHLENQTQGQFHYPAITQGKDGTLHVVYSHFVEQGKSMKHAAFNEAWVKAGDELSQATIKAAVGKSLPLLEKGAKGSMTERKQCFTCHNQGLPILALTTARSRGFEIDEEHIQSQLKLTADFLAKNKTRYLEGKGQGGAADMAGYALWTLELGGWKPDETTAAVAEYFLLFQKDRDHWEPVSHRPPTEHSPFTTNFVSLQSLKAFGTDSLRDRATARSEQVRQWLLKAEPQDTEDRVFRLRALQVAGASDDEVRRATTDLLRTQRDDGGWAQLADLPSDAYATGSALVALYQAGGIATEAAAYQKGLSYLVSTQHADGSWHVTTRSKPIQTYFESGYPHGKDQFISIAAAGWSTTALALALPKPSSETK